MVPMSAEPPISEGFVTFRGHRRWYRVVGDREAAGATGGSEYQEDLRRRLPGSAWVVFEESAHLPHLEEPERFREVVEAFLDGVEGGAA